MQAQTQSNAIAADADGDAYVTGVDGTGHVILQEYVAGATALTTPQDLGAGTWPAVAAGAQHSAVVANKDASGNIQVQVVVFP